MCHHRTEIGKVSTRFENDACLELKKMKQITDDIQLWWFTKPYFCFYK